MNSRTSENSIYKQPVLQLNKKKGINMNIVAIYIPPRLMINILEYKEFFSYMYHRWIIRRDFNANHKH